MRWIDRLKNAEMGQICTAKTAITPLSAVSAVTSGRICEKRVFLNGSEKALEGAEKLDSGRLDLPAPAPPDNSAVVAANKALYTRFVLAAYRACNTPEERLSMRTDCLEMELKYVQEWIDHFEKAYPAA